MDIFGIELIHFVLIIATQLGFILALVFSLIAFGRFSADTRKAFGIFWVVILFITANCFNLLHTGSEILRHANTPESTMEPQIVLNLVYAFHIFLLLMSICGIVMANRIKQTSEEFAIKK